MGYHVGARSGYDQVPVREMVYNKFHQRYEFWEDENANGPTIFWTPAEQEFKVPNHTGHDQLPTIPPMITVLPIPEEQGGWIETFPEGGERSFRDYILILPIPDLPAVYVYFSKPPISLIEVDAYKNFSKRPRQGLHADHMPSQAAVRKFLRDNHPTLSPQEIDDIVSRVASIGIPAWIHQRISETYGGRNTLEQIAKDSSNLKNALENNFSTIRPILSEIGISDDKLDEAKQKMHTINQLLGLYD